MIMVASSMPLLDTVGCVLFCPKNHVSSGETRCSWAATHKSDFPMCVTAHDNLTAVALEMAPSMGGILA
jgi:hypothetical protein